MKLKDICKFVNEKVDTSSFHLEDYVSTENLLPNKGGVTVASKIPQGKATLFKKGDILISNIRPYFKKIYLAKKQGCCSNDVLCIRPNSNIPSSYLYYLLSQDSFFDYVMTGAKGTKMPRGDKGHIMNWAVYQSTLSQQQNIAEILAPLDDKIAVNSRICANLEAQAEALFKSWFVDFTPFKDQPFVDSELGPIPQGWKVGKINEFVDVIYGAPYKSKLFNTQKEGLPLIRIRDLKTCSPQFYTKELLPNTELVNYGDVVAGMDAEFTPHIWLGETGLLNQRVCKFKPHTGISPLYSMLMIKPKLEFAQNYKVGTTVSHLGKSDIDKFIIIVPPLDIVKEVSSIFDAVLNEQINLAKENQRLAALRDTLLPKLMSGEIKL